MASSHHTPTFNLKAVVQETGLKPDTLRAWERRYGLPQPQRSEGGHRLYSQRDIDLLKWLVERQQEGLSISRAIDLWHQLEAENIDPLQASGPGVGPPPPPPLPSLGETVIELRRTWISACLEFDEQRAEYILTQAFALYPSEIVCLELLQKGLAYIGEGWYCREITAQQEHFASALANRRLELLISATPAPTRSGRILVGCPPAEEHTFGPLLLTLLLRRQGWEVVYLGANIPLIHLEKTMAVTKPHLVILSAQRLTTAATLFEMARLLYREGIPLAFGGLIFNNIPALRKRIFGHFLGERIDLAPGVVQQFLSSSYQPLAVEEPTAVYQEALSHYRERLALIEAEIWQMMRLATIPHIHTINSHNNLAQNIIAALTLGDMEFIENDITWLEGLLLNTQIPLTQLYDYLNAYTKATKMYLDERGTLIVTWLDRLIANFQAG
jgi:DNA-binding transcriptional MerR regulator